MNHESAYASLRADILGRHFALGKFWRANHFTNVNLLGELGDARLPAPGKVAHLPCSGDPCVPRRAPYSTDASRPGIAPAPAYDTPTARTADDMPAHGIGDIERWRVWTHDRTNALKMSGLRLIQLCVEHRLGQPQAAGIIAEILNTTAALFKFPEASQFGGYILRWDAVGDDEWEVEVDSKGRLTPLMPCRFLLNSDLKGFASQRYLYCTPLDDPRYRRAVEAGIAAGRIGDGQDRFRRWEPSKDEYIGLLAGLSEVFDTFSSSMDDAHRAITESVRAQCKRIARYLQASAYLLVRPCGGVTARGAGEILPLLEFPFNRVFERILGDPFEGTGRYADALAAAGIRPRQTLGSAGLNLLAATRAALEWIRDNSDGRFSTDIGELARNVDARAQADLVRLWQDRRMIDAVHIEMQGEVLAGMVFNGLPRALREKQFRQWLRSPGRNVADAFKPYVALMVLHDDRQIAETYLEWFDRTFVDWDSPQLAAGANDWSFAAAVAMLAAWELGDHPRRLAYAGLVDKRLGEMYRQLHEADPSAARHRPSLFAVMGRGSAPGGHHESAECSLSAPRVLVSEFHDKVGNWFGYMPTLALAWRHLFEGAPAFSPSSGIALPAPERTRDWPEPAVPAAVIAEARERPDRMPVPLRAISAATPDPDGQHDMPLFRDPPRRPLDNEVGRPPRPAGSTVTFALRGRVLRHSATLDFDYAAPATLGTDAANWTRAPAFDLSEQTLVEHWAYRIDGQRLRLEVTLRAAAVEWVRGRLGLSLPRLRYAQLSGTLSLAWVRQR